MTSPLRVAARPSRRPNMRRAVILFPSGFTLANLFFGIFAIIAASRLQFVTAGVYVLIGGICDALDGRVARATNAGTQFGEELDSLVDAITFGLAPGMIMYFAVLNRDGWDWVWVFIFAACAVMRLARFNIEQAGTSKTYFQGLPSPAAGITLASYYWFSQSWLYSYGAIGNLRWHVLLRFLMGALAALMISNVPYPVFPRTGVRSLRALGASLVVLGAIVLLATRRLEYFFPLSLVYVVWGLFRWVFGGLFERRQPTLPYDLSEGEDDEEELEDVSAAVHAERQGFRDSRSPRGHRTVRRSAPTEPPASGVASTALTPERDERRERGERTDAERAARREARENRERKERLRRERRASRDGALPSPGPGASAAAPGASQAPAQAPASVDSSTAESRDAGTDHEGDSSTAPADDASAAPPRKRKRRRRRGERGRGTEAAAAPAQTEAADEGAPVHPIGGENRATTAAPVTPSLPQPNGSE